MHELALGFLLLFAPPPVEVASVPAQVLDRALADPCAAARAIVEQGPCLRPEDCGAFEGWMRLFGQPRTEPLDPRRTEIRRRPPSFMCPAPAPRLE